jgi:hypothetical protein
MNHEFIFSGRSVLFVDISCPFLGLEKPNLQKQTNKIAFKRVTFFFFFRKNKEESTFISSRFSNYKMLLYFILNPSRFMKNLIISRNLTKKMYDIIVN